MNSNRLKLTVGAAAVAAALTGAYSLGHATMSGAPAPAAVSQAPAATAALPDMSSIVARNSPSVVNISVSGTRKGGPNASRNPSSMKTNPFRSSSVASAFRKTGVTCRCGAWVQVSSSAPTEPS